MKYTTIETNNLTDNQAQHICLNDLIDLVVVKEGNTFSVKVLDLPNHEVKADVINYDEYCELLK